MSVSGCGKVKFISGGRCSSVYLPELRIEHIDKDFVCLDKKFLLLAVVILNNSIPILNFKSSSPEIWSIVFTYDWFESLIFIPIFTKPK